jgi:hypothetical protein
MSQTGHQRKWTRTSASAPQTRSAKGAMRTLMPLRSPLDQYDASQHQRSADDLRGDWRFAEQGESQRRTENRHEIDELPGAAWSQLRHPVRPE